MKASEHIQWHTHQSLFPKGLSNKVAFCFQLQKKSIYGKSNPVIVKHFYSDSSIVALDYGNLDIYRNMLR